MPGSAATSASTCARAASVASAGPGPFEVEMLEAEDSSLIAHDCAAADNAANAVGSLLPRHRQPRRRGRLLAPGRRSGGARQRRATVDRRCIGAGLAGTAGRARGL